MIFRRRTRTAAAAAAAAVAAAIAWRRQGKTRTVWPLGDEYRHRRLRAGKNDPRTRICNKECVKNVGIIRIF